ncbi:ABC transporter substrate-binding protein [Desulfovibrio psychrotolerans]|uniref:Amino acid ABC transporter substrate-binding protein n=1 Tax=Desulfovibrio psychrotolerans TaxID=415242 RepID=A0A7J0BU59_9BACT|nr:ABC transporter substrate-binding protein [Desulfovibrio psychrotolerans]GFM36731.1 amino acid ABC transporter substrate-binding protein [Desulfovibrio psychrotolerans]
MLRKSTLLVAALSFVLLFGSMAFAQKHYVNGIDANYPPFGYIDASGKPAGFDVDSLNWIAEKMGFTVEHKPMEWSTIVQSLVSKKIDLVYSGMSITEERAKQVNFSDPYWKVAQVIVAKKDSGLTVDGAMKGGKALGVQSGTSEADSLQNMVGKDGYSYDLKYYDSAPLAIMDILNGRVPAAAMDIAPANDAIAHGKDIEIAGEFGEPEFFGVAVRKDDAELLETINKGLKLLMADPYWEELKAKHLKDGSH